MKRIEADLLILGRGEPVAPGRVVLDGATIQYAGSPHAAPPAAPTDEVYQVPVVMPGMWDCHVHLFGLTSADLRELLHTPVPLAAARAVTDLAAALQAGFTSVREVGGLGLGLAPAVAEGTIPGPRVYAAGAVLSATGGHGDIHSFPLPWLGEYAARGGSLQLCDGVPECLRGVRRQLREGADVIKICATGGVLSERTDPELAQFSAAELEAIVDEATRADRLVAAHCHGKAGIVAALKAGIRTIEHGTYLDEPTAALMKETGAIMVPTRYITERVLEQGAKLGMRQYALDKMVAVGARQAEAVRWARAAEVPIALGTDSFSSGTGSVSPWGHHGLELGYLVEQGLTPLEAIEAATANGPLTLGPRAPQSGLLAAGYDADVIAVARSPLDDIAVLADPSQITHVWQGGELVKG